MKSAQDYSAGDSPAFTLKINNEKDVSIDYIVKEADGIWQECLKRKVHFGDTVASDALSAEMSKRYPDFSNSYPIVLRYICQMKEYKGKVFRRWLTKINIHPWKTESEYLDAQADYVAMLYQAIKGRSTNKTQVSNLRTNIRKMLQQEHDQFKHYAAEFGNEVDANECSNRKKTIDQLHDFVTTIGPTGMAMAEVVRVVTDEAPCSDPDTLFSLFRQNLYAGGQVGQTGQIKSSDILA